MNDEGKRRKRVHWFSTQWVAVQCALESLYVRLRQYQSSRYKAVPVFSTDLATTFTKYPSPWFSQVIYLSDT